MASAEPRESGLDGVYTSTYMYVCICICIYIYARSKPEAPIIIAIAKVFAYAMHELSIIISRIYITSFPCAFAFYLSRKIALHKSGQILRIRSMVGRKPYQAPYHLAICQRSALQISAINDDCI